MKTFGELEVGDIFFRYNKGGDRIETRRVLKITERKATVLIECAYDLLGRRSFVLLPKEESTCDKDFVVLFSCKNAVEEYLLQRTRKENERHSRELKTIQELREQYERVRM